MNDHVGTIYTMAPEVIYRKYTNKADMWSIGVLAFMLLSSQMPFYGKKKRHVLEHITSCRYKMKGKRWEEEISDDAKEFVTSLLQLDPHSRPSARGLLRHSKWLESKNEMRNALMDTMGHRIRDSCSSINTDALFDINESMSNASCCSDTAETYISSSRDHERDSSFDSVTTQEELIASMERFSNYGKLKRLAMMIIAHNSTTEELGYLKTAFSIYDLDGKGTLSLDDFKKALSFSSAPEKKLEKMFRKVNLDGTGNIHYTEFLAATLEAKGVIEEERLAEAFDRLDSDDSGYISIDDLQDLFRGELSVESIRNMIRDADFDHDDKISYGDFLSLWLRGSEEQNRSHRGSLRNRTSGRNPELPPLGRKKKELPQEQDDFGFFSDEDDNPLTLGIPVNLSVYNKKHGNDGVTDLMKRGSSHGYMFS